MNNAGAAAIANGNPELVPLRGGCAGGAAGAAGSLGAASGGTGGGALQLSVMGQLNISGKVGAPGREGEAGAGGADECGGGGGGGSGGAVLLEALHVMIASGAVISANGGAGSGGDPDPGDALIDGVKGNPGSIIDAQPARGGTSAGGGDGGSGGAGTTLPTVGRDGDPGNGDLPGGGGGGGSVGRIRINVVPGGTCQVMGLVTPPATGNCP